MSGSPLNPQNAGKLLRVSMEGDTAEQVVEYYRLTGHETEAEIDEFAKEAFFNRFNYGYSIVDETDYADDEVIES